MLNDVILVFLLLALNMSHIFQAFFLLTNKGKDYLH